MKSINNKKTCARKKKRSVSSDLRSSQERKRVASEKAREERLRENGDRSMERFRAKLRLSDILTSKDNVADGDGTTAGCDNAKNDASSSSTSASSSASSSHGSSSRSSTATASNDADSAAEDAEKKPDATDQLD